MAAAARSISFVERLRGRRPSPSNGLEVDDLAGQRAPARRFTPAGRRDRPAATPCRGARGRLRRPARPRCWGRCTPAPRQYQAFRRHLVLHVVVAQRDVGPLLGASSRRSTSAPPYSTVCRLGGETPLRPRRAAPAPGASGVPSGRSDGRSRSARAPGAARRTPRSSAGYYQAARLVARPLDAQLLEEAQDRAGLRRPRGVVVAGDRARSAPWGAPRGAAGIARRRRRWRRWWAGPSGRDRPATTTASGRAAMTPSIGQRGRRGRRRPRAG